MEFTSEEEEGTQITPNVVDMTTSERVSGLYPRHVLLHVLVILSATI